MDTDHKKTVLKNGFLSQQEQRIKPAYLLSSRFFVLSTTMTYYIALDQKLSQSDDRAAGFP